MPTSHPGCFFGITAYGSDRFYADNSLSIYNQTISLDKWRAAFKKCDYDNTDSILRDEVPIVVQHLYWGRTPAAEEIDSFMLHFDSKSAGKIMWSEFTECLEAFRKCPVPEGAAVANQEFFSSENYREAWRKHTRLASGPKQILQHPITTSQQHGFLAEEVIDANGGSNDKFRRKWTDIVQYGDCVDRDNQGRTVASEMSPSMKKTLHDAQGSSIMIL